MRSRHELFDLIERELTDLLPQGEPERLYEPIRYMMGIGGKRLRPVMMLMSHELFGGDAKELLKPAAGIEVFHNFTLLHDDIMDKAPLRRSMETVHKKWNPDIAILSGDSMFVLACSLMMQVKNEHLRKVMDVFLENALRVCEGQQLDMDFEGLDDISIDDYLDMAGRKTAALIACSIMIGSLCAGASDVDAKHMYDFGYNLGIAFQIHDDLLDAFGDSKKFGKQMGGDILSNKKTILLLTARREAGEAEQRELHRWMHAADIQPQEKVQAVINIYEGLDVKQKVSQVMQEYLANAMKELQATSAPEKNKSVMKSLAEELMKRES